MKKVFSIILGLAMGIGVVSAQSTFQGTLTYEMKLIGEGMEAYQAMMPNAIVISVLKSKSTIDYEGGMFASMLGRMMTDNKKGISYMIKESEETIYVLDPKKMQEEGSDPAATPEPQITKEEEVIDIAGYSCQKYKVVSDGPMGQQESYVWVTDKFKMPTSESSSNMSMGGGMINVKGLPGTPLKIMSSQGPMTVALTAKSVDLSTPDKAKFKLPKGYKQEPFDASAIMGGMGM